MTLPSIMASTKPDAGRPSMVTETHSSCWDSEQEASRRQRNGLDILIASERAPEMLVPSLGT